MDHVGVLKQNYRFFCPMAPALDVRLRAGDTVIRIPQHLIVQGCAIRLPNVIAREGLQGGYAFRPVVVAEPAHGSLTFIGVGWVYRRTAGYTGGDAMKYKLVNDDLQIESEAGVITLRA